MCADDFGLGTSACLSILQLASAGAITATSCAVDGAVAAVHAGELRALRPRVGVGLHLNLTENPEYTGSRPLLRWVLSTYARGSLDRLSLLQEIRRQLLRFEELFGAAPDYVDGHEHVHQLPVIRELLVAELKLRYGERVALRSTLTRSARGAKAGLIQRLGAAQLAHLANRAGLHCNSDFAGVYNLSGDRPYAPRMEAWLRNIEDGGLIMCHPELPSVTTARPGARAREHRFLSSPAWPQLLQRCAVSLVAFRGRG